MGSAEDDYPRKPHQQQQPLPNKTKFKFLLLLIFTNLITFYLFSSNTNSPSLDFLSFHPALIHQDQHLQLQQQLNSTQSQLDLTQAQITNLHSQLVSSNSLLETLLSELGRTTHSAASDSSSSSSLSLPAADNDQIVNQLFQTMVMSDELKLAVLPHKLPLGYTPRSDSDDLNPPVGAGCLRFKDELNQYMNYDVGSVCPVDDIFAQRLILRGCEPLPRRRCHPKAPTGYVEPVPYPKSLWTTPSDKSIIWDPYTCKSYKCLIDRKNEKGFYDCKDCFDLGGRERTRWLFDNGGLDYGIDEVLRTKPPGTVRIGFDIGGGTGTFAARMRERNITIITSSMNLDGPFNSFIASRGLISMHMSVSQRLPFFENTLDIVHSMHVLSNWIPDPMLEFTLYDIYRVLRPGGLFWLDRFFCLGSQLNATYVPMIDRIGFKKLRWNAGMKLDRGVEMNEWYFSALLEKPMT